MRRWTSIWTFFDRATSPLTSVLFQYLGNGTRRVPANETAFGHRGALTEWATNAVFLDPGESEIHIRWVREFASALSPFSSGPYINQVGSEAEEGAAEIQAAFGEQLRETGRSQAPVRPDQHVQPQPQYTNKVVGG